MLKKLLGFFLLIITANVVSLGNSDSLRIALRNAETDTLRIKICHELSQQFEKTSPDSALSWIYRGLEIAKKSDIKNPSDSILLYYRGVFHTSIAMIYAKMAKDLPFAKEHIDTGAIYFNHIINNSRNKNIKIKSLQGLSVAYSLLGRIAFTKGDIDVAIQNYSLALEIQEKLQSGHGLAMMYNNLGVLHRQQAKYSQAMIFHEKALSVFEQNNDSMNIAAVKVNIAVTAREMGVYDLSLHNYMQALQIFRLFKNDSYLASTYTNIGEIYSSTSSWEKAIEHFRLASILYKKLNDSKGIASCAYQIGVCYRKQGLADSTLHYLNAAKLKFEKIGDKIGISSVLQQFGEHYFDKKNYPTALSYFIRSESISSSIGLNQSVAQSKHSIAQTYLHQGDLVQALAYAQSALKLSDEFRLIEIKKDVHKTLSQIYEDNKQYSPALYHFKNFFMLYDSISSVRSSQKFSDIETLYQLEQKQRTIAQLEKDRAIKEIELGKAKTKISWQRLHSMLNLVVLALLTIVLISLYRQYILKRKSNKLLRLQYSEIHQKSEEILAQKEEIESQRNELEQQKEILKEKSDQLERFNWLITDSIDYASSIQSALMPSAGVFEQFFPDHFIMFFPKDVVSGDFYWAYPHQDTIIVVLSDCTGHGVPGGFMSMLGISALTELMVRGFTNPAEILDNLRLLVIESFKQTGKIGEHQDGMDVSIISYTKGQDHLTFAGANHPLCIIRKNESTGEYQLIEKKGDRMPVSYHFNMKPFTNHRIDIRPNDQIYLFTDGFRDQLGGKNFREKYGKENFISLLVKNSNLPMDEQKNILEDTFFRWVGGNDQLDDITIVGMKI